MAIAPAHSVICPLDTFTITPIGYFYRVQWPPKKFNWPNGHDKSIFHVPNLSIWIPEISIKRPFQYLTHLFFNIQSSLKVRDILLPCNKNKIDEEHWSWRISESVQNQCTGACVFATFHLRHKCHIRIRNRQKDSKRRFLVQNFIEMSQKIPELWTKRMPWQVGKI